MAGGYTCCIDKERLTNSIETLSSIENCLQTRNLSDDFIEIEEIIKTVNFDHNNCISNYKDKINYILEEITKIKKEINNLNNSLSKTVIEFSNIDEFKTKDIENIFNYFDNDTNIDNMAINNNLKVANTTSLFKENINSLTTAMNLRSTDLIKNIGTNIADVSNNEINTVPIGLGIGAAGVTASVGAIIVDSMNNTKGESYEQYYEPTQEMKYDYDNLEKVEHDRLQEEVQKKEEEEEIIPYSANRNTEVTNKFYDDEQ